MASITPHYTWTDPETGDLCCAATGDGWDPSAALLYGGAAAREILRLAKESADP